MGERDGGAGAGGTVRDDLESAWSELEGASGDESGGAPTGGESAPSGAAAAGAGESGGVKPDIDAGEKTGEKSITQGDRPRDEHGRFAKKEGDEADPKASAPASGAAPDPKASEGQKTAQQPEAAEGPPSNWNDISADDWGKVPASVRSKIAVRETQIASGFQQINQGLAPLLAQAKVRGISWQEGLQRLTQAQSMLETDPSGALIKLAQAYKVNLDDLAEIAAGTMPHPGRSSQPANGNGHADPQLVNRLQTIEQQLQEQRLAPLLSEVQSFRASVDFFDELTSTINQFIPGVKANYPGADHRTILQHAYSAAVATRPDIQQRIKAKAEAKAQEERRQAEEKARAQRGGSAASVHLNGQPGGTALNATNRSVGSVADDLLATWDELAAR